MTYFVKCFATSIGHEVDPGVWMSYGCSYPDKHAGPHSFEWLEVSILLRNEHIYRKRRHFMELRLRAATEIERLAKRLREYETKERQSRPVA